ncbi:MAG: DUF2335 domain-containing protein [Bacteroidaceae bacterium]|nr:DUF2335 domain-containing protein [Bacteroidaceae bacterium]
MSNPKKVPAPAQEENKLTDINEVLETLTPDQRQVIEGTIIALEQRSFSGPLPAPEDFETYEKVLPGSTDRILTMTEKSLDSRISNEKTIIETRLKQSGRGQILGFILALFFGAMALVLALTNHEALAGIIATGDIISLAIIFVLNREPRQKGD